MTKEQAIEKFQAIQRGSGLNRDHFPHLLKGEIARAQWGNTEFGYGMEYGYLLALIDTFDLTLEDLGWTEQEALQAEDSRYG